jgi:hypothetical protein
VLDGRLEDSAVDRLVEAGEQCAIPILAKCHERANQGVGSPVLDAGHDQVSRRGDARDRLAVLDTPGDQ